MANPGNPPAFLLAHPPVDRDHEILVAFLAKLESAIAAGETWQHFAALTLELRAYADGHFENEEELMRASSYPNLPAHKAEHENMTAQLTRLTDSIRTGDTVAVADLVFLLKKYITEHMCGTDRLLTEYLKQHNAGQPKSSPG